MEKKRDIIVLAGGCFDVLHPGHLEFLSKAKALGNKLIILLESDINIRRLKGNSRPINDQKRRKDNLLKTGIVDIIIPLTSKVSDEYYDEVVKSVNPDIIAVTKGDPLLKKKLRQAKSIGCNLKVVMDRNKKYSTTKILNK